MSKLIAFALSMLCSIAFAQTNVCNVPQPNTTVYYQDLANTGGVFECMPAPGGPGVGFTVKTNTAGVMTYWYCLKDGKYKPQFGAASWARIASGSLKPDTPMSDPSLTPVWCPFQAEMYAKKPADPPAANALVTISVISYNTTATGLSSIAGTISKGLACDCTTSLKIGTVTYCTFAGAAKPSIRASCAKP